MTSSKALDKFYTKPTLASYLNSVLTRLFYIPKTAYILEPSAGSGNFLIDFEEYNYLAYDIMPEDKRINPKQPIQQANFLEVELPRTDYIVIGNPPFGKRSKLAIQFFNKCAKHSHIIAMVLPYNFAKWGTQKQLDSSMKLVYQERLGDNSFLLDGVEKDLRCVYQIWVKSGSIYDLGRNERVQKPPIQLDGLTIWQHNATETSRKYVDYDWHYCWYRQGYKDYSKRFQKDVDYAFVYDRVYNSNDQFFFVRIDNKELEPIILSLNIPELAKQSLSTPGFGKQDFIAEVIENKQS